MNELLNDTRFWLVTLGAAVGGFVRYLWTRQERRIDAMEASMVLRKEFDELRADFQTKLRENGEKLDKGFGRIETLMREDRKQTDDHREKLRTSLDDLRTEVAVLKAEGPFDDAGRLRR